MSDLKKQLDVDILRFFDNISTQDRADKIKSLRDLFDKYIHLSTCSHNFDHNDLNHIISGAKKIFAEARMPIHLGKNKRLVNQTELPNLCVIESTISYLNKNDCLKRLPKFDKRDDKF